YRLLYFLTLSVLISSTQVHAEPLKTISLAPHITELVYAAGAGDTLVGVSAYSNHPEQATQKPIIGDAFRVDLEKIIALQPDMVFYWQGTTTQQVLQQLSQHKLKTIPIKIESLADIGQALITIAEQLNLPRPTRYDEFMNRLHKLQEQTHKSQSVFIQLSEQPLYTVSASHWMSEAAALCGLENIFQDLATTAATVNKEAVIGHNPDVIIRMQAINENSPLQQWPQISAIQNKHIVVLNPDIFSRPTPRIINAVEDLCRQVSQFSDNAGE
ncbi:MAG: helical backbone metal receptor, partial [Proteobacteria bacterium]|nr:helical backbone metal receptor [Pseudomonadota bacterium]